METRRQLADKQQSLANLEKLVNQYESDRDKYATLLEQIHSDKQTISRALTQNNELKAQLVELQDAFVRVTQEKADLMNRLQAEEFKTKQLASTKPDETTSNVVRLSNEAELSADWADEGVETERSESAGAALSHGSSSLMDSIKVYLL